MENEVDTKEVLAAWEAAEAAVRARMADVGVAERTQVAGLSGMETFQRMFDGTLPGVPIGRTLGFVPVEIAYGRAVFQGRPASSTTTRSAPCTAAGSRRCSIRASAAPSTPPCPRARPTPPPSSR